MYEYRRLFVYLRPYLARLLFAAALLALSGALMGAVVSTIKPLVNDVLLGGATMDGPRHIWWNFVASSKERIEAAKEAWRAGDWAHGRFRLPVGDDQEFIPAPAV